MIYLYDLPFNNITTISDLEGPHRLLPHDEEVLIICYNSYELTMTVSYDFGVRLHIRPVHLLRVSLLRVRESNFPGDSL